MILVSSFIHQTPATANKYKIILFDGKLQQYFHCQNRIEYQACSLFVFGLCCSPCTTCKIMLLKQNIEQSQQKKLKRVNYFIKKQQIKCQPSLNIYISLSSGVISCSFFNRSLSGDWARNLLNNSFVMMDLSARSLKVKRYLSQGKWRESFLTNKESLFYVSFATNKY